jgi:serine protease Do
MTMIDHARHIVTRSGALRPLALALMLGAGLGYGLGAAPLSNTAFAADPAPSLVTAQPSFAPLVARTKPAVVQISTRSRPALAAADGYGELPAPYAEMLRRYGRGMPDRRGQGSGFIIDPAGYIVTNNHVVDGAREVTVTLMDGEQHTARVIGRDPMTDVALVKVDAPKPLPFVSFGDSDTAREGDWVLSVGNPFGLGGTVTAGIVSARGRDINEGPYDDFLQIDAPINPGNSGGPLFNQAGQVVGINTAIYSPSGGSVGIGFAVPSNLARSVVTQLKEHGRVERGWLGVSMQAVTPAIAKAAGLSRNDGVLVAAVTPDSPASRAGLRSGDVITGFDAKPVRTTRDLAMAVASTPAGRSVAVELMRDDARRTVNVRIMAQEPARTALLQ